MTENKKSSTFYTSFFYYFHCILYIVHYNLFIFLDRIPKSVYRRQDCVPIVYVTGSHYEVGYMVVRKLHNVMLLELVYVI